MRTSVLEHARERKRIRESEMPQYAFGARVCDPQQRDLPGDVLRLTEPRSANLDTARESGGAPQDRRRLGGSRRGTSAG